MNGYNYIFVTLFILVVYFIIMYILSKNDKL